ncbi:MAG TPA: hypothetical protein VLX92_24400 [Kofleriaceae bacterium]|nr:hypothetical protein [Kofleriaceae bacterium]
MRVKKFEGATMRDAIAKVKAELGEHAVIIATREVRRGLLGAGIEISAAIDDHEDGPVESTTARRPEELDKLLDPLRSELRSLRAIVRTAGGDTRASELRAEVAALRKVVDDLRSEPAARPNGSVPSPKKGAPLVAPSLGKVVMLVGPTGAGKTTTIAKLAANAALVEQRRVGLITLDNYRVGGIEQIRTFAELIGVPVQVAESPAALRTLINPNDELTLIDTAGRSPRDAAAIAELARHIEGLEIEVHLVVPAGTSAAHLDQLAQRYRALGPVRLLFTKLDEVDRAPELAAAPGRLELPITWVTTGQAVPEDIEQPTAVRVLDLAANGLSALSTTSAA